MDVPKRILMRVLSTYLGQFVEGLDSENLQVAVWNGKIDLHNLALKDGVRGSGGRGTGAGRGKGRGRRSASHAPPPALPPFLFPARGKGEFAAYKHG